jgi:surface protein
MFYTNTGFNGDISGWDVSSVRIYARARSMDATSFNKDLSGWNVGNVGYCPGFYEGATSWALPKPNFTLCTP